VDPDTKGRTAGHSSTLPKVAVQWLNKVLCSEIATFLNPQTFTGRCKMAA